MTNQDHVERIMKAVRDMKDDDEIERTVLEALQETYRRGRKEVYRNENIIRNEDMGR